MTAEATPRARYGRNQLYFDDEIIFYLTSMAKALVAGTEAAITVDEFTRGYLREKITRDHPELVVLYEEYCKAKQQARKSYQAVEDKTIKALQPL